MKNRPVASDGKTSLGQLSDDDSFDFVAVMVFALAALGLGGVSLLSLLNLIGVII